MIIQIDVLEQHPLLLCFKSFCLLPAALIFKVLPASVAIKELQRFSLEPVLWRFISFHSSYVAPCPATGSWLHSTFTQSGSSAVFAIHLSVFS